MAQAQRPIVGFGSTLRTIVVKPSMCISAITFAQPKHRY
jgi:hypothetical protein